MGRSSGTTGAEFDLVPGKEMGSIRTGIILRPFVRHILFSSLSFPHLISGRFPVGRPLPSAMSRPTAKILSAAKAPLSTNHPREQTGQVFSREALDTVYFPVYLKVYSQRGLPSGGGPCRGAPHHRIPFRRRVRCMKQCCTVLLRVSMGLVTIQDSIGD